MAASSPAGFSVSSSTPSASDRFNEFVMKGLDSEDQLSSWGALCGAGFSHRPGDPDRFRRKYVADPTASLALTRVAVQVLEDRMAGTVRLFQREWVMDNGETVSTVGLGEVCTHPDFRGKGIASLLMKDAVAQCEALASAQLSTLHAAATVGPLYQKYGYSAVPIPYGRLALSGDVSSGETADASAPSFASARCHSGHEAVLTQGKVDWKAQHSRLSELHIACSRVLRLAGATVRATEYWTRWMPNVAGGRCFLFTANGGDPKALDDIVAYAIVLRKNDHYRLADLGATPQIAGCPEALLGVLVQAAAASVRADIAEGKIVDATDAGVATGMAVPTVVLRAAGAVSGADLAPESEGSAAAPTGGAVAKSSGLSSADAATAAAAPCGASQLTLRYPSFDDDGWMLRPLRRDDGKGEAAIARFKAAADEGRFLVWLVDSF
jgi:GNAT superfamily N-acetyltransferase